jgi:UDP-N-acetylglucosamine 2-epimerase (non-hydrolysing)
MACDGTRGEGYDRPMAVDVCFVVGARPNFMKVAPVFEALRRQRPELELLLVHTGQHYDRAMSDVFFAELGLPPADVLLHVGSGTHGEQTGRTITGMEDVVALHRPRLLVVAGDVNSTLGAALAGAKAGVRVAHVEAGLRSFDLRMPEEINRRLTDHLSSLLLTHSPDAVENLRREGIAGDHVALVGNTMIVTLLRFVEAARARTPWERFELDPGSYALVTLHRPELVDDPALLEPTAEALISLASELPVVFPLHPRTRGHLDELGLTERLERSVLLAPPLGYLDFLGLEAEARFVLTDSGGIQEETSALGVPCFTLRDSTERPITIELGSNTLLGIRPERIAEVPTLAALREPGRPIPLWDAEAGERAAAAIAAFVEDPAPVAVL